MYKIWKILNFHNIGRTLCVYDKSSVYVDIEYDPEYVRIHVKFYIV